jgi:hypothetical protein
MGRDSYRKGRPNYETWGALKDENNGLLFTKIFFYFASKSPNVGAFFIISNASTNISFTPP